MEATNAPLALVVAREKKKQVRVKDKSRLSPCATKYLSALCDPEGTPTGACVPWGFPVPSFKEKGFCRTRMALGTTGFGYALMSAATSSNSTALTLTSSTSVGGSGTALNAFTNLTTASYPNLSYPSASLSSTGVQSRMVSQSLKVRYAGTENGRNGTIYSYEDPTHQPLTAQTFQSIVNKPITASCRPAMDGSWTTVNWSGPSVPQETDFGTVAIFDSTVDYIGVLIQGAAGDIYDVESFIHVEYCGGVPMVGPAEADPDGYAKVVEAVKTFTVNSPFMGEMASSVYKYASGQAMGMARSALKNALSPGLMSGNLNRLQ